MKIPPDRVEEKHQIMLGNWNRWPLVKSSDPAISDVMSDEVLREIETFLQGVAKDYQAMK
jgi:hypothetical protein